MNKREMKILGDAWIREVTSATSHGLDIFQTKNKLAEKLVADGLLMHAKEVLGGRFPVTVAGYRLTHAGRALYCSIC